MNRPYQVKAGRLSIEDPNRPDNDISAGSTSIGIVLRSFSHAYDTLQQTMLALGQRDFSRRHGQSLLGTIVGGNYASFDTQRQRMRRVYEERWGPHRIGVSNHHY